VNLTPSSSSVTGAKMKKDMMVMILNRLMLSSRTEPCIRGNIVRLYVHEKHKWHVQLCMQC